MAIPPFPVIELSLDYRYMFATDITNCYGTLNPQVIEWAFMLKGTALKPHLLITWERTSAVTFVPCSRGATLVYRKVVPSLTLWHLLDNDKPGVSIDEQRALYINFCMRHPKLKRDSEDFANQLMQDEYYNCLKVEYRSRLNFSGEVKILVSTSSKFNLHLSFS